MIHMTRRDAVRATALATLAATALPAWAQTVAVSAGDRATWDLSELFADDAAWDAARKAVLARVPALAAYKGRLGTSARTLAEAMTLQSDIGRMAGRVTAYASLKGDEDLRVPAGQERIAQARDMGTAIAEGSAWLSPELLTLGKAKIAAFVAEDRTLATRFDFELADTLREAEHTLTPEGEALLAGARAAFAGADAVRGQLVAADIPWPTIALSSGKTVRLDDQGYTLNRAAPVRADRKAVFDAFWGQYGKFRNSLGAAYLAHVKADVFRAKARRHPSALAASLSNNAIPEGVYRTLVREANAGLPQLHRYFALRQKLLGLPDLAYYDIYPPLVSQTRKVTIPEMRATVLDAVKPLGADYVAMLASATAKRWMDPLPRPGKASGAYMNPGAYDVHPYLLLNLGETYDGMSTFAHEWGHAMHSLLADQAQVYEKTRYPLFIAEIASTCNEQLLAAHMVATAKTRQEKLFYLGQQLESIRGTFFRQTMFAEFELAVHDRAEAGEGLSGAKLSAAYLDLLKRYHGPGVAMDPAYAVEWAYIPHFYNSFYVYQYATCISAASYFAHAILTGGVSARDTYLGVLKAGGSDYPVEVLKRAGLDMTTPAPYRAVIATFQATLDQAEALMA